MSETIVIVPYRAAWNAQFEIERRALEAALPKEAVLAVEHFGSTAIPGMPAKPIVDVLIAVTSLTEARRAFPEILDSLGYDFWTDNPKRDRLFFVKGMPPRGKVRTHHIHVCEPDGEVWERRLFRDYLIAHPDRASDYARLKNRLAAMFAEDREGYTRAKEGFIAEIMAEARRLRAPTFFGAYGVSVGCAIRLASGGASSRQSSMRKP